MSITPTFVTTSHAVRPAASTPYNCVLFPAISNARYSHFVRRRIHHRLPRILPALVSWSTQKNFCNDCLPSSNSYSRYIAHETRMSSALSSTESESLHEGDEIGNQSTSQMSGFRYISWAEVERLSRAIVQQMNGMKFDLVLAITRGGLTPAALICEAFELRNVLSVTAIFYSDHRQPFYGMTEPRFLSFPSLDALEGRSVLIVDDVWDSGTTAYAVRSRVLRARPRCVKVAVLHFKSERNRYPDDGPDFYAENTNNWIIYPWEAMSPKAPSCATELLPEIDSSSESSHSPISS